MERAAWDIKLHGLKGRPAEACALYDSLFQLEGGDMTASTQIILGFPELVPLALCRREELAARGVNVDELYAATEKTRAFNTAVQTGEIFDIAINSLINPGTDRR